jgi:hypothetical protein
MKHSYSAVVLSFLALSVSAFKIPLPNVKFVLNAKNSLDISFNVHEIDVNMKKLAISLAIAPLLLASTSIAAYADEPKDGQKYYWGVGCFWHAQHEFVEAEKRILGRTDEQLTV